MVILPKIPGKEFCYPALKIPSTDYGYPAKIPGEEYGYPA